MKNIHAAVLFENASAFSIEQVDLADPKDEEVLVQVGALGVCHSDWNLVTGCTPHPKPVVCGHEGAGTVVAVGNGVKDLHNGQRVALSWAPGCGQCRYCRNSRPALCSASHDAIWAGTLLDGSPRLSLNGEPIFHYCGLACFAEYAVVPRASCVALPDSIPMDVAAIIGCAVTTGVGAAIHTAKIQPEETVLIIGTGGVGLCSVMGAKLRNAGRIIAVDKLPHRLDLAREMGATDVLSPTDELPQHVREITDGGVDVAIDTTGVGAAQHAAIAATRPGGRIALVGLASTTETLAIHTAQLVREEKTIMGSYYGSADPAVDFPRIAEWFAQGKLPLDRLISRHYSLEQINEAYEHMHAGEIARGIIQFP